jgi:hypothetical protein
VNEENQRHSTSTSMVELSSTQVDAGNDLMLKVKVECPFKCNLQNAKVRIADDSGVIIKEIELTCFDGTVNETAEFSIKAPINPGEYTWNVLFEGEETTDLAHEESSAKFSFVVKPHTTSMVVWDVPSPIVWNDKFAIKVGVQCLAGCNLAGSVIEIYNHEQTPVARATLGDALLSATSPLHWAEVELQAPSTEGYYYWTARFAKPDLGLAHEGTRCEFAFGIVQPPEHVVTVEVIEKGEKTPIANAQVILHPYRGLTDEHGVAKISVTKGEYKLLIPRDEKHLKFRTTLNVASDIEIKAELEVAPEDPS